MPTNTETASAFKQGGKALQGFSGHSAIQPQINNSEVLASKQQCSSSVSI